MLHDWLEVMKALSENKDSTQDLICPACGTKSIKYIYVGDSVTRIGYLPIWVYELQYGDTNK